MVNKLKIASKEELVSILEQAAGIADLAPEEHKSGVFQAALQAIFQNEFVGNSVPKSSTFENASESNTALAQANTSNLAALTGLTEEKLSNIFNFEVNPFRLIKSSGESVTEAMQHNTLLLLYGWKHAYGVNNVLASVLKDQLTQSRVNVSTIYGNSLSNINSWVYRKGKPGSKQATYSLTRPGEVKSVDLLKEMLTKIEAGAKK